MPSTLYTTTLAPVLIYTPSVAGTPHVVIFNVGSAVAYIGGASVTPYAGMPLYPNNQISLPYAPVALYAVAGYTATGTATTIATAAVSAGASTGTLAAAFTAASYCVLSSTATLSNGGELTYNSSTTTTAAFAPALLYDHRLGASVTPVTIAGTQIRVDEGTF